MVQILAHLISNAASALSGSGQEEKRLRLKLEKSGELLLRISVEDNGVGIAPEHLEMLFRAGFTTKEEGHGFGLHGSILTAKALGGSILAKSEGWGRGAVFTLELPLVSARAGRGPPYLGSAACSCSSRLKKMSTFLPLETPE